MRCVQRYLILVGLVATAPLPLGAQAGEANLPAPLVTAMLEGARNFDEYDRENGGRYMYFTSQLPPSWPAALVPPSPATLVGGRRTGLITVAVFHDTSRKFLANFFQQLERSGYHQPLRPARPGFGIGADAYDFFCKDSARVQATAVSGAENGAFIYVKLTRTPYPNCIPEADQRYNEMLVHFARGLTIPTLLAPPGMATEALDMGDNQREKWSRTELSSAVVVPAAVLQHYITQLTKSGWVAEQQVSNDQLAAVLLSAKDEQGKKWKGSLTVGARGSLASVLVTMHPVNEP